MVGIGENLHRDIKGFVKAHEFFFHQNSQQLGDCDRWMGIIELYNPTLGKMGEIMPKLFSITPNHTLEGSAGEEILLLQPQTLALHGIVIGIKTRRNGFGFVAILHSFAVFLLVKQFKIESVYRLCLPQAQSVNGFSAITDDRHIVRHCPYILPPEVNFFPLFLAANAPRITELLPVVRGFLLKSAFDGLTEQAVFVPDSKAIQRDILCSG